LKMTNDGDVAIIICARVADERYCPEGMLTNCTECDAPVWQTREGSDQADVMTYDAKPICAYCALKLNVPPEEAERIRHYLFLMRYRKLMNRLSGADSAPPNEGIRS
jgi:hypothetical protein